MNCGQYFVIFDRFYPKLVYQNCRNMKKILVASVFMLVLVGMAAAQSTGHGHHRKHHHHRKHRV